jgi:hypothetical protein
MGSKDWTKLPVEIASSACQWLMIRWTGGYGRNPAFSNDNFKWEAPEEPPTPAALFDVIAELHVEIQLLEARLEKLEAKHG